MLEILKNKQVKTQIIKWLFAQISEEQIKDTMRWIILETIKRIPADKRKAAVRLALETIDQAQELLESAK